MMIYDDVSLPCSWKLVGTLAFANYVIVIHKKMQVYACMISREGILQKI